MHEKNALALRRQVSVAARNIRDVIVFRSSVGRAARIRRWPIATYSAKAAAKISSRPKSQRPVFRKTRGAAWLSSGFREKVSDVRELIAREARVKSALTQKVYGLKRRLRISVASFCTEGIAINRTYGRRRNRF